ncbi:bile acid:sodium symporter family protein [Gaoshiqia sediminis]|uniref:Bile acid:sodium symporter n=1 Tax=Gaoshiqia sediminis TaxID=2986998 RepID=A0AA42C496_9BACT|nr:bile acid:sodium symporter family protein [Gaoshiqia sediminis]MCW0481548.1 bile acid:sodium symporter [Gaoshiqia sediminis]
MSSFNFKTLRRYLPDGFITGILSMIILAWLIPGIGGEGSVVELKVVIKYGIALLFFFYGLRLSPDKLVTDLSNWRLHLMIQTITFLVFPLVVLLFRPLLKGTENEILWLAVFFLAALPSTVSSSVVMVSIAEGNLPSAIFNASISGVIGILITPTWMGIFMEKHQETFAFGEVLRDLVMQILIPFCAGLLLHRFWGQWANRNRRYISLFDKSVILSIVYRSFSDSFLKGIFSSIKLTELLLLSASVLTLFFFIFEGTKLLTRLMRFNREDRITVLFCSSKKSLIHGSVMVGVLFAGSTLGSLFLVPVMIYHAFQLFYISIVARRYHREMLTSTR